MENISAISTASVRRTSLRGRLWPAAAAAFFGLRCWSRYQMPTPASTIIASNAKSENTARLFWPCGSTTQAASSGPKAAPALPPTWKIDCARPCRPPEAMRATRDASG